MIYLIVILLNLEIILIVQSFRERTASISNNEQDLNFIASVRNFNLFLCSHIQFTEMDQNH